MEKIWFKSYPPGVPHEIQPEQYSSLSDLLERSFREHADSPFSVCMDRWMSYRELDEHSVALGAWLQGQGLEPGSRVAIMLPNLPQFAVTMAGVIRAGYTCVNVNPLYTARELEHQLKDSGATAIVILENFAHTLQEVIRHTGIRHTVVTSLGDMLGAVYGRWMTFAVRHLAKLVPEFSLPLDQDRTVTPWKQALAQGRRMNLKSTAQNMDSIAFLQYTGGTTGLSKGAMLTHRNVVAAMLQAEAWFAPALADVGDLRKVNSIAALPLYHIFALTLCLMAIRQGSHLTLIPNPRDFGKFIEVLKKRPFHLLPGVNTLFNALLNHPMFKTVDFSALRLTQAGGMAASEGTARHWQQATGCPMVEGWGMSETCAIGTNNPVTQKAKTFTPDGFMRTGDIGIMDSEGFTRIVDRKKDMIIVSGFNVFPNELENVISTCPGVVECAAVGVPDSMQGEAIKVFVVRNDPLLTEDAVSRFCHDNLTGYKRPKYVEFRDELPKSNVGKILRRELRTGK